MQIAVAVGAPVLAAIVWSFLVAPGSESRLADPWRFIPEFLVFGCAAAGLARAHHARLGVAFALVAVLNSALDRAFGV